MTKNQKLVIHHLSDLHIGRFHYRPAIKVPHVPAGDLGRGNLVKYEEYLAKTPERPHLVIISGDLTSIADQKEMNDATDFIRRVVALLEKSRPWEPGGLPYVLIVPGNHDLDWACDQYEQKIERYARLASSLYNGGRVISANYHDMPEAIKCIDAGPLPGVFVAAINTTALGGTLHPALQQVHARMKEAYAALQRDNDQIPRALEELEAAMRQDPGWVRLADVETLTEAFLRCTTDGPRLGIAVLHHNPSSVPADDIEIFDTIINAGRVKQALTAAGFHLVLHGHRHYEHLARETYPTQSDYNDLLIVGADSIGCKEAAAFLEITVSGIAASDPASLDGPGWLVRIDSVSLSGPGAGRKTLHEEFHATRLARVLRLVQRSLGGATLSPDALSAADLRDLVYSLQDLLNRSHGWDERAAKGWMKTFLFSLPAYMRVYATDVWDRSGIASPQFHIYLRDQFRERSTRLRREAAARPAAPAGPRILTFSPDLYNAIIRTRWRPDPGNWGDAVIHPGDPEKHPPALEIARILVRPGGAEEDRDALAKLDFDHKVHAVPLFVIDGSRLQPDESVDFALGIGPDGNVQRAFEYDRGSNPRRVVEIDLSEDDRGQELHDLFLNLLKHPDLQTVDQYIKSAGIMIHNPKKLKSLAATYDRTRRTSQTILRNLESILSPKPTEAGLDVGCGTGNYTVPFVGRFARLCGLDISEDMLRQARPKSDAVEWTLSNALHPPYPEQSFDKIWGISTLHYFLSQNQLLLFDEMHRLLRPGGTLVFDTEFSEQHPSLWLVEFFPSLRERYRHALFPRQYYQDNLRAVGFTSVECREVDLDANETDAFLRIGQRNPAVYLDPQTLANIPAFVDMDRSERDAGIAALRESIRTGSITQTIERYRAQATVGGDLGFVIARKA
jgi:ubiquinone/menaquinone biosynthesis C-methylase UbiE/3',5'-cyclic AMP phosphodiesterase CpdA